MVESQRRFRFRTPAVRIPFSKVRPEPALNSTPRSREPPVAKQTLTLPVIQNWSCHNCGGCCREHLIEITDAEKSRIEGQNWTADDGVPSDRPLIQPMGRGRFRLAHQDDGACVFLDPGGLCRIHAKFGEPAKPLACRVYPYAFHPVSGNLSVSLRFSCPSVVQNLGQRVVEQKPDLDQLASLVTAGSTKSFEPPLIHGSQKVDWSDVLQFLTAFDEELSDDSVNFATRLMRVLTWLELVEQSAFDKVRGGRLKEYLDVLTKASRKAQPDSDLPVLKPTRMGRLLFRMLVAQLLRHDTEATAQGGLMTRFGLLSAGLKFTFAVGQVPKLQESISVKKVFGDSTESRMSPRFADLESSFAGRTNEIDRLMTRYFRVKIQGLHFCGAANFDWNLVDGFRSLALMYPATLYIARLRASRQQRQQLELSDVQAALATLDHNYAYSPATGNASALKRIRILGRLQQITALCGWYSQ